MPGNYGARTLGEIRNDQFNAAHNSNGASGYSGTGFPGRGTYDYKAARATEAAVEARRAGEESQRAVDEARAIKQQERAEWNAKLKQLKFEAREQGCKTLEERFAPKVEEADDVLNGRTEFVYTQEEKAELAEELLTGVAVGHQGCLYGLVRLIEADHVHMTDTDGQRGIFKLYGNNNPQASSWLAKKELGWNQYKKENAETLFKNLYKSIVKLDPDQPLSNELLKFTRESFEKEVVGGMRGLLTIEFKEYVDLGFGIKKTHTSFFEHPELHEVGGGYQDDSVELSGAHDSSGGDTTGCFDGMCSIM